MKVTFSAPGKIALCGEHAVVYGYPALVSAINRRIQASVEARSDRLIKIYAMDLYVPGVILTFKEDDPELVVETDYGRIVNAVSYIRKAIEIASGHICSSQGVNVTIQSEMPVGAGLGTSAAVAVSTIAAYAKMMGHDLSLEEVAKLGHQVELEVQGIASPMDTTITTYGGTLYVRPVKPRPHIEDVKVISKLPSVIGYTEREFKTADLLQRVRALKDSAPDIVDSIMETIGKTVESSKKALKKGDLEYLGSLMNVNHGLLEALGVSSKKLNDMVYSARFAGALGSKLTGAGGGGCMIAICPNKEADVSTAIRVIGGIPIQVSLSGSGLRLESVEK